MGKTPQFAEKMSRALGSVCCTESEAEELNSVAKPESDAVPWLPWVVGVVFLGVSDVGVVYGGYGCMVGIGGTDGEHGANQSMPKSTKSPH